MFAWQFSTDKNRPKSWYIIALIIVLFLVVYGVFEQMYLMSVVAFLFAGVYIMMENNATPVTSVQITEKSIQVNSTIYEMEKISKFALLSHEGMVVMLRIFPKKSITAIVDIPLTSEVDADALKAFLETRVEFDANSDWQKSDRLIHAMRL